MSSLFTGLSAFPLTPVRNDGVDYDGVVRIVSTVAQDEPDSICVLGSTGSYAYLTADERRQVATVAATAVGAVPMIVGVGAIATREVLRNVEGAQSAGANGVLLAPVSYQALTPDEVYGLYEEVTNELSVPLCVYDNPVTTHFKFSDELLAAIARLPNVGSIKIPAVSSIEEEARQRVTSLRQVIPGSVTIGVSGDGAGAMGLVAGCDAWYSVLAGTWPEPCLAITRAAQSGRSAEAFSRSEALAEVWRLFGQFGSLRVVAEIAEYRGIASSDHLPHPVKPLPEEARRQVETIIASLEVH